MRRRALSMVEALVAALVLAVAITGLLSFTSQESRGVAMTEERFYATMALTELREAFANRPLYFYQDKGFPQSADTFPPLLATMIEDHPFTLPLPPGEGSPVTGALETRNQELGLERLVLFEPFTTADGTDAGLVTFLVRYRNRAGQPREIDTVQVVF